MCVILPPSKTLTTLLRPGAATHIPPSASKLIPSGAKDLRLAHTQRPEREPSSIISNAVNLAANVSAMIRV